ncbi:MAG: threonine/serine dehydratase [Anaerolineae bacterium]|nr:threonine/serine dehydratase [Anaerolineae bacterium]MDQ7033742.1 threonine/serine dehydratase [Anaerolineae bacterium]
MVQFTDIFHAQQRIKPYLKPTPLEAAAHLGKDIWLKLENANKTHSFKIRGALNTILALDDAAREKGMIAASSGNHAQGVAYAAHLVGAQAQILMPKHTPQKKVKGVQLYGGEALLYGDNYDETEAEALRRARVEGKTYISPYNDAAIIAGTGTIGLEIVESLPDVERVLVCVSGGGLISGVALAIKALRPDCTVIGVCAESAPSMYNAFKQTKLPENWDTLAEALSGGIEEGSMTVPIVQESVDDIVLVSEEQIAAAMRFMLGTQGWLVEGGGCVCVAALLHDIVPRDGKITAAMISGGNVDLETLRQIL